jgi:thioredoxin-related protein
MSRLAQILWLVISMVCGSTFAQSEIRWAPDLATARRGAAQFQVPLLIHFYGDNCLPCKTLEQRVLSQDSVVKTLNKYFICVRVNASQERATAAEYQVHSWPTDVFVSPDGHVLHQGVCKQDISGYMEVLQNVAVSNRDRNTMLAAEKAQSADSKQVASNTAQGQPKPSSSSLPPAAAQPSNTPYAAPPAIAASTPAAQFQIAPPTRTNMMDSQAGLPPLAAHMSSKPLGSDGLGTSNNVSGQMNATTNLPQVTSPANIAQKQTARNSTATLVSNPYYPESEAMVCTPDGKCGPASSTSVAATQQVPGNQQKPMQSSSIHLVSNSAANAGPQFPPLPNNTTLPAPTFQPKSTADSNLQPSNEPLLGLIETPSPEVTEPAAYNGCCPIALVKTGHKVQGTIANAVRHRGRTYLMESPEAVKEFMKSPDRYSPVLSGYDAMIFLETGKLVDGTLDYALHDPNSGVVILFANADSQNKFKADPARNTKALGYILNAASKK